MMPYDSNPHFLGRDDLLKSLRDKLKETKPKQYNHRVAIYGMGGVGKTQVAIEYVYRHENDYDNVYWISASDQAALLSGFQEVGTRTDV
jgi:Cdc6-like AAA superfamily ATPase